MPNITYAVASDDLDALSAQFEARTPRAVDAEGTPTETVAAHVERAMTALLDAEVRAARRQAADEAVESAQTDAELKSALLARHKLARA